MPSRKDLSIAHKMHFPTLAQGKDKMIYIKIKSYKVYDTLQAIL